MLRKFWFAKKCWSKKVWCKIRLVNKNVCQRKFASKNILEPKIFWVQKYFDLSQLEQFWLDMTCPDLTCSDLTCPNLTCPDVTCPDYNLAHFCFKNVSSLSPDCSRSVSEGFQGCFEPHFLIKSSLMSKSMWILNFNAIRLFKTSLILMAMSKNHMLSKKVL